MPLCGAAIRPPDLPSVSPASLSIRLLRSARAVVEPVGDITAQLAVLGNPCVRLAERGTADRPGAARSEAEPESPGENETQTARCDERLDLSRFSWGFSSSDVPISGPTLPGRFDLTEL